MALYVVVVQKELIGVYLKGPFLNGIFHTDPLIAQANDIQ